MGAAVKPRSAHVVTLFDGGDGGELGFIELIVAVREAFEVLDFPLLFLTSPSLVALHVFSTRERFEVGWGCSTRTIRLPRIQDTDRHA